MAKTQDEIEQKRIAYKSYKWAVYNEAVLEDDNLVLGSDFLREQSVWHRHSLLKVLLETKKEKQFSEGIGIVNRNRDVGLYVSDCDANKPKVSVYQGENNLYEGRNFRRGFNKLLKAIS